MYQWHYVILYCTDKHSWVGMPRQNYRVLVLKPCALLKKKITSTAMEAFSVSLLFHEFLSQDQEPIVAIGDPDFQCWDPSFGPFLHPLRLPRVSTLHCFVLFDHELSSSRSPRSVVSCTTAFNNICLDRSSHVFALTGPRSHPSFWSKVWKIPNRDKWYIVQRQLHW